jgi:hypothetical protein
MLAFIDSVINDMSFKRSKRKLVSAALYDIANEHGKGICTLFENKHDVCGFSMMRIQFETFVRAAWLLHCATDNEIANFINNDELKADDKRKLYFSVMVREIENAIGLSCTLSEITKNSWKALNSYTHGGQLQVSRRFDGETIEAHHEPEQVEETVKFSAMLSFLVFCEMVQLTEKQEYDAMTQQLYDKLSGWVL